MASSTTISPAKAIEVYEERHEKAIRMFCDLHLTPSKSATPAETKQRTLHKDDVHVFVGEWDEEGVYVYQAFSHAIADWALKEQLLGGPKFNPTRMTWIKPSFAWVLYRSAYARKHNQGRILKLKLSHGAFGDLLRQCQCKDGAGGSLGRVQWDPARDLLRGDGKVPRKLLRRRAIQIGLKGRLSEAYVRSVLSIQDVTGLAKQLHQAHRNMVSNSKMKQQAGLKAMAVLLPKLPVERPYMPQCKERDLIKLKMLLSSE